MKTEDKLVDRLKLLWGELTDTELPQSVAHKFLYSAVDEVEGVDFPSDTQYHWDDTNAKIVFDTEPSIASQVLYVYKALILLGQSKEGRAIMDGGGITWRSGVNSISTDGQSIAFRDRRKQIVNIYNDLLGRARLNKLNVDIGELIVTYNGRLE